jgi:hypothetical protein
MIDLNKLIDWYNSRRSKLTYSMHGSRNGADGTADCSGAMTEALYYAGASQYAYLYSTVTLSNYLAYNSFTCISKNEDWNAKKGDVVLMSWGSSMAESGGSGGHVGVMLDDVNFISVDYSTGGASGSAVSSHNWNSYYAITSPKYIEVWRYNLQPKVNNPSVKTATNPPAAALSAAGTYKIISNVAYVRDKPSDTSNIVATYNLGDTVNILSVQNGWASYIGITSGLVRYIRVANMKLI